MNLKTARIRTCYASLYNGWLVRDKTSRVTLGYVDKLILTNVDFVIYEKAKARHMAGKTTEPWAYIDGDVVFLGKPSHKRNANKLVRIQEQKQHYLKNIKYFDDPTWWEDQGNMVVLDPNDNHFSMFNPIDGEKSPIHYAQYCMLDSNVFAFVGEEEGLRNVK